MREASHEDVDVILVHLHLCDRKVGPRCDGTKYLFHVFAIRSKERHSILYNEYEVVGNEKLHSVRPLVIHQLNNSAEPLTMSDRLDERCFDWSV